MRCLDSFNLRLVPQRANATCAVVGSSDHSKQQVHLLLDMFRVHQNIEYDTKLVAGVFAVPVRHRILRMRIEKVKQFVRVVENFIELIRYDKGWRKRTDIQS